MPSVEPSTPPIQRRPPFCYWVMFCLRHLPRTNSPPRYPFVACYSSSAPAPGSSSRWTLTLISLTRTTTTTTTIVVVAVVVVVPAPSLSIPYSSLITVVGPGRWAAASSSHAIAIPCCSILHGQLYVRACGRRGRPGPGLLLSARLSRYYYYSVSFRFDDE